ncbi:hypothetical protein GCM10027404_02750 [Arthrobacter tumbae]|uniref:phosphotransferase n=1 Tax=Arthrobacter tumbae TaxID=163874 RepID=UPI0027DB438F|nr:phosphotransferase [Arthrobacter tumbae]MBM7780281.1 hypothetical protein [Arthrobacter tumbae]
MTEADELALLEGRAIGPALEAAAAALTGSLDQWSLRGIHHRPGAGVTGIYALRCKTPGGPLNGFLCVTTRPVAGTFPRSVRLRGPAGMALLAWSHPNDPLLPDLGWACDARSVGPALFGVPTATLTTLGYRPMRRAVLRAEGAGQTRFLKVLPHDRAAALHERHRLLLGAGIPVPQPADSPRRDVLVTRPSAGTPLAQRLLADGATGLEPEVLVDLLKRLPRTVCSLPARRPWSAGVRSYASAATAVLPSESERISVLASRVESVIRTASAGPVVATHGDFYEGNLLVEGGSITALLDLDGVGPGHLVDDLACFLAHLAVLPCVDERYTEVPAAQSRFQRAFEEYVDPTALRARAAGVALTLVAGARNSGEDQAGGGWRAGALRRLGVAENFL